MATKDELPRCDLCHRPCATPRIPVNVVYKFTKTHMTWTQYMCRLHSYPKYFDESFCGDYMYGDYVKVNGDIWFWPTDSTGRPAPKSTIDVTGAVLDDYEWGYPEDMSVFVDWDCYMTPRMKARRPAKPLLPRLGNLPDNPALFEALDHPDYPSTDEFEPRATDPAAWVAYMRQLTDAQRAAIRDLYNACVDIADRDAELDEHHLNERERPCADSRSG